MSILHHRSQNHQSVRAAPDRLTADLQKDLQHNRLTQVNSQAKAQYVCLPLRLVPKHNDGRRRIHDLFFPYGQLVNDRMPQDCGGLEYATYGDAVYALLSRLCGAQPVKRDLKDALRHVPVAFPDQWVLGFY